MSKFGVLEKQFDYKGHDCIVYSTALDIDVDMYR